MQKKYKDYKKICLANGSHPEEILWSRTKPLVSFGYINSLRGGIPNWSPTHKTRKTPTVL